MSERQRSHWGWGYADRLPTEKARRGLIQTVRVLLGGGDFSLRPLPGVDSVRLPEPRVSAAALPELALSDVGTRARHTYGKAYPDLIRGLAGDYAVAPDVVCYPSSEDDIHRIIDWCEKERVAAIPYGGGTSVVGGIEAALDGDFRGAVTVDLGRMDRVLDIDLVSRAARIQAGASGPILEGQLAEHGMTLRHFPQSFEFSTLGGWIATRAGGHFATRYTHIDDLCESVRMLTPRGPWESRRLPGSGAGPSPDRMVLGSEGSLGIITEAWMRIRPRPRWRTSTSARFRGFSDAVAATRAVAQSGLEPSNCRLLDAREALLHQVALDGRCVLLLGFESADHPVDHAMGRVVELCRDHGGDVSEPTRSDSDEPTSDRRSEDAGAWRAAFIDAPYLLNSIVSIGGLAETFETACTWDRFEELHARVIRAAVDTGKRECGAVFVACRFSHVYADGPAPYYTVIAPTRVGGELSQWGALKDAISDAITDSGGTITHHHAVGRTHRPWYRRQRPGLFGEVLKAAKATVDPSGILNPGVLI